MGFNSCPSSESGILSKNTKVIALETTLQQCVLNFKELIVDLEQLQIESDHYRSQYIEWKEKCESKKCSGVEELQKDIIKKNEIIQSVASILTKLYRTNDINILSEAFKVLNQETTLTLLDNKENLKEITPAKDISLPNNIQKLSPKSSRTPKKTGSPTKIKSLKNETPKKYNGTPKKSPKRDISITEDVSFNEESVCEIDGTPTGRTSPIIPSKRSKSTLVKTTDSREKKKLPDGWSSSSAKTLKLTCTTPTGSRGRMIQSRIKVLKVKPSTVVDLTCSPEVKSDVIVKSEFVQALVKKESIESDDTILPSPTSNNSIFKPTSISSPIKFKRPALKLIKTEKVDKQDENTDITKMEESISIMNRINGRIKVKTETPTYTEPMDEDATHCETEFSVSLLEPVNRLDKEHYKLLENSPSKKPLAENINIMNTPPKGDGDSSISLLRTNNVPLNNVKRKLPELVEPIYKETAPRKKAEKRALQGWSCDDCKNFYGALYKDDPVMLARKIEECSKHRGKHNPARPKTPEGFWNPRWEVPEDTEELNRMNNAV